jgi:hypothetical protein
MESSDSVCVQTVCSEVGSIFSQAMAALVIQSRCECALRISINWHVALEPSDLSELTLRLIEETEVTPPLSSDRGNGSPADPACHGEELS